MEMERNANEIEIVVRKIGDDIGHDQVRAKKFFVCFSLKLIKILNLTILHSCNNFQFIKQIKLNNSAQPCID